MIKIAITDDHPFLLQGVKNILDAQGKELVALLRKDFPSVRILILTSNDNAYNIQIILNAGAQGYLLKNIEQNLLIEAIETYRLGIMQKLGVKNMVGMVKKQLCLVLFSKLHYGS